MCPGKGGRPRSGAPQQGPGQAFLSCFPSVKSVGPHWVKWGALLRRASLHRTQAPEGPACPESGCRAGGIGMGPATTPRRAGLSGKQDPRPHPGILPNGGLCQPANRRLVQEAVTHPQEQGYLRRPGRRRPGPAMSPQPHPAGLQPFPPSQPRTRFPFLPLPWGGEGRPAPQCKR